MDRANSEWCKVLIVDDEVLIRQGVKHYINWEQEGFQIVGEASNGKEAIELIELLESSHCDYRYCYASHGWNGIDSLHQKSLSGN